MSPQLEGEALQVNRFARRNRHLRVFSKKDLMKMRGGIALKVVFAPLIAVVRSMPVQRSLDFMYGFKSFFTDILPVTPKGKLLFQGVILSLTTLTVTSVTQGTTFTSNPVAYTPEYSESYSLPGDILVPDDNGYLVKINPQTDEASRVGLTDFAKHEVESGETLSVIAARYGVSTDTIMWENNIRDARSLRVGQELAIPPVDGVSYQVRSGDDLADIAEKYSITEEAIIAQNSLDEGTEIVKGQDLFLPGAEPVRTAPTVIASAGSSDLQYRVSSATRAASTVDWDVMPTGPSSAGGETPLIYPTIGTITQGFHSGHYALDIANRSKPAIWAAKDGEVIKATVGQWSGGYGNHIVIDHGDGTQTLYAHMESLNKGVGDYVSQGDVIGKMGATGRVYGVTGIHLHFEYRVNGVKVNPAYYY